MHAADRLWPLQPPLASHDVAFSLDQVSVELAPDADAELMEGYQRYAALHGWRFEPLDVSETGLGGFKEASAAITGRAGSL